MGWETDFIMKHDTKSFDPIFSRALFVLTRAPTAVTELVVKRNASATTARTVILSTATAGVSQATEDLR